MKVLIRADSSIDIGSGHIMRCLTLAVELKKKGAEVSFISRPHKGNLNFLILQKGFDVIELKNKNMNYKNWLGTSETQDCSQSINLIKDNFIPDWLIIDHYFIGSTWEKKISPYVKKIMVIDDQADRFHECDLLLDHNCFKNFSLRYSNLVSSKCTKLLGPEYALLRPEFYQSRKLIENKKFKINNLFVFFGGSDPEGLTLKTLKSLFDDKLSHLKVDVVIGKTNTNSKKIINLAKHRPHTHVYVQVDNISKLMLKADLAIGSGGVNALERMCLGLPSVAISFAKNQEIILKDLSENNLIDYLGLSTKIKKESISNKIIDLIKNPQKMIQQKENIKNIVKGDGAKKVCELLMQGQS